MLLSLSGILRVNMVQLISICCSKYSHYEIHSALFAFRMANFYFRLQKDLEKHDPSVSIQGFEKPECVCV